MIGRDDFAAASLSWLRETEDLQKTLGENEETRNEWRRRQGIDPDAFDFVTQNIVNSMLSSIVAGIPASVVVAVAFSAGFDLAWVAYRDQLGQIANEVPA